MAPRTTTPGLRALNPTTPIGYTSWGPIWAAAGSRVGGSRGVDFFVGDDEGPDPDEDDDSDGDDEDDDNDDRQRQRAQDRRDAARGWQPERRRRIERDDDDDEDDEPEDRNRRADQREGTDDGDGEDWEPPSRESWTRLQDAVSRNNNELRKRRFLGKPLEKLGITDEETLRDRLIDWGIDPDTGERLTGVGDDSGDGEDSFFDYPTTGRDDEQQQPATRTRAEVAAERRRFEERGAARAAAKLKHGMAFYAAEAELRAQGFTGKNLELPIRLIDIDQVDVQLDDSGWPEVFGLVEQIKKIKEDVPEWFRPRREPRPDADSQERPRREGRRVGGGAREVDGGERRRSGGRPQTWLQRTDDQLMGRGRR